MQDLDVRVPEASAVWPKRDHCITTAPLVIVLFVQKQANRHSGMDHSSRPPIDIPAGRHGSSSATPNFVTPSTSPPAPLFMMHASGSLKGATAKNSLAGSHEPDPNHKPTSSSNALHVNEHASPAATHESSASKSSSEGTEAGPAGSKPEHHAPAGGNGPSEAGKESLSPIPEEPKGNHAGSTDHADVLRARPFIIRTVKLGASEGAGHVTGSILSQSLDKILTATKRTDAGTLSLAGLRKLVPQMSRYPSIEKFCTQSGTLIDDEAISFSEYLGLEGDSEASAPGSGTPSLKLYFRSTKLGESAGKGAGGADASSLTEFKPVDLGEKLAVQIEREASIEGGLLEKSEKSADLIEAEAFGPSEGKSAGTLHENEWAVVLRNCAVFYGWIIDPFSKRIVRAPKPAFRLRSKVDQTSVAGIPDFVASEESTPQDNAIIMTGEQNEAEALIATREAEAATEKKKEDASTKNDGEVPTEKKDGEVPIDKKKDEVPTEKNKTEVSTEKKKTKASTDAAQVNSEDSVESLVPTSDKGIPNFRVNDDSRIEITAHETELSVSMAKSDFSESSTEASVGGSGYGFSASISGGTASSQSKQSKAMDAATHKTLIARYMFPRCDLLLWPDEMEPTEELAGLIETIRKTKNIKALRKLHQEYGQLFCQRITLGGRLLSTKIVDSTEKKTEEQQKESFKSSIGASISGGYGGFSASASVKHDSASGNATENANAAREQKETAVFEAVGGDTIMANNPSGWSGTVAKFENWRVINRDGLSPLVEIISGMPGYEAVQSWFVQAVPALSRYILLDESHECKARLRVLSPTNSLSIENKGNNASFYLGHDVDRAVTPRLNGVASIEQYWGRVDIQYAIPIFNPQTYRAPTILGYENFKVEDTFYGAKWNAAYVKSVWTMIAPFDEELKHGTRVILRTLPFSDPENKPKDKDTVTTPNASHMVVFRNAQGEFLPAMSDSDEYQYWRLLKVDPSQLHIKPGDEVRLAWDFGDQTTGWRDFTQDVFGRRQVCAGEDLRGPLFLKVPWPRFEHSGNPTAMIMSREQADVTQKVMNTNDNGPDGGKDKLVQYSIQDVRFRIDNVGNGGRGDVDDYLLNKLEMQKDIQARVDVRINGLPMQMRSSVFWLGII
ncbi:hypothetical protein P171DRAFT_509315 [Karstenula rhodostoma CBS 690.94]|uniref:MACPF-like domain-containing protein n=1 Tax=Karstenula rhodostoma CBS 690.94 TaxID=1392251 RepID=A0A9P4PPK1_9PLEO|nr:hypothetical protein P171DRAFT_509315 [Karstenula rhodostoma CBS 690.94]